MSMKLTPDYAKSIVERRTERNMTRKELAEKIEVPATSLARYENLESKTIPREVFVKIEEALPISLEHYESFSSALKADASLRDWVARLSKEEKLFNKMNNPALDSELEILTSLLSAPQKRRLLYLALALYRGDF